jgi:hypothetical protein
MLRHSLPGYRRRMRDGEPGKGVILEVEERHAWTLGAFKWSLRIRVLGDRAKDQEFTAMADTRDLLGEFAHAGDIWPIRLGVGEDLPAEVDFPALQKEITAERERIEAEHLRLGLERAKKGDAEAPDA